jgi:hypothetical protein
MSTSTLTDAQPDATDSACLRTTLVVSACVALVVFSSVACWFSARRTRSRTHTARKSSRSKRHCLPATISVWCTTASELLDSIRNGLVRSLLSVWQMRRNSPKHGRHSAAPRLTVASHDL